MKNLATLFILLILFSWKALAQLPGLTITGSPQSIQGATWTYQDSVNGTWYDLEGILFEPALGLPPYPAVIINHGTGGNVNGYSKSVAKEMVQWGFVCIATNLCHSSGVPIGSPGDTSFINLGASTNNYLRDMACWNILASLGTIDTNCIMSFGHSRGAYTTTGLVATYPGKFSCAGHTSGGAIQPAGYSAPTIALAAQITCPYIIHHGDADSVVPVTYDSTLNHVFDSTGIDHRFYVYSGYSHSQMSMDSLMFARTKDWFLNHACIHTGVTPTSDENNPLQLIYHNSESIELLLPEEKNYILTLLNSTGERIYSSTYNSREPLYTGKWANGIYFIVLTGSGHMYRSKIIVYH